MKRVNFIKVKKNQNTLCGFGLNFTLKPFQILAVGAKNLLILNKALFDGLPSIVIASLIGTSAEMNPEETLEISALQASSLCEFIYERMTFGLKINRLFN